MVQQLINEACKAAQSGKLTFFVGAGISKPSGLPTSAEIIDICIKQLIDGTPHNLSCSKLFPKDFGRNLRLEYFCQSLAEVNESACLLPLRLLAGGKPSVLHYFLATCAKRGFATTIVTTNFDLLIERALDDLSVPYKVLYSDNDFAGFSTDTKSVTLIKIHGTLDSQSYEPLPGILADVRSVGKGLSERRQSILKAIAKKNNLLFLGYSGRDYFGAMTALFSSQPLPVYWVNHSSADSDTNLVVKNWVFNATGGVYIDTDTGNVATAIGNKLAVEVQNQPEEVRANREFNIADSLSRLERSFALAYLYSRDRRSDNTIVNSSFRECEDMFLRERSVDPVLHGRLLLQWVRTLERSGRTPSQYGEAIRILRKAEPLVSNHECVAADVKVALYDMEYSLAYTLGGSGIEYLPLIEMLIDQCLICGDPVVLSRAYSTMARIYQNSFEPKLAGYPMALDCYDLAVKALEPMGAQDILLILHFERFKLATALQRGNEAARAIISCLRGALLLADRPNADWVQGILRYIFLFVSNERYKTQKDWMVAELGLLGLDPASIR